MQHIGDLFQNRYDQYLSGRFENDLYFCSLLKFGERPSKLILANKCKTTGGSRSSSFFSVKKKNEFDISRSNCKTENEEGNGFLYWKRNIDIHSKHYKKRK